MRPLQRTAIEHLELHGCRVEFETRIIHRDDGTTARLSANEVALLRHLAQRPGESVSRDALLREVWGYAPSVKSRAIDLTILRLRRKIEIDPTTPRHLQTVQRVGVRFIPKATGRGEGPVLLLTDGWVDLSIGAVERAGQRSQIGERSLMLLRRLFGHPEPIPLAALEAELGTGLRWVIRRLRNTIEVDSSQPRHLVALRGRGFVLRGRAEEPLLHSHNLDPVETSPPDAALEQPGMHVVAHTLRETRALLERAVAERRLDEAWCVSLVGGRLDSLPHRMAVIAGTHAHSLTSLGRELAGRGRVGLMLVGPPTPAAAAEPLLREAPELRILMGSHISDEPTQASLRTAWEAVSVFSGFFTTRDARQVASTAAPALRALAQAGLVDRCDDHWTVVAPSAYVPLGILNQHAAWALEHGTQRMMELSEGRIPHVAGEPYGLVSDLRRALTHAESAGLSTLREPLRVQLSRALGHVGLHEERWAVLEGSSDAGAQAEAIHAERAVTSCLIGRIQDAEPEARRALRSADGQVRASAFFSLFNVFQTGDYVGADTRHLVRQMIADDGLPLTARVRVGVLAAQVAMFNGEHEHARTTLIATERSYRAIITPGQRIWFRRASGDLALFAFDDPATALGHYAEMRACAQTARRPDREVRALSQGAHALRLLGRVDEAGAWLDQAIALARIINHRLGEIVALAELVPHALWIEEPNLADEVLTELRTASLNAADQQIYLRTSTAYRRWFGGALLGVADMLSETWERYQRARFAQPLLEVGLFRASAMIVSERTEEAQAHWEMALTLRATSPATEAFARLGSALLHILSPEVFPPIEAPAFRQRERVALTTLRRVLDAARDGSWPG